MSRLTRFSRGKIWFVDIGPCKRFDIFHVWLGPFYVQTWSAGPFLYLDDDFILRQIWFTGCIVRPLSEKLLRVDLFSPPRRTICNVLSFRQHELTLSLRHRWNIFFISWPNLFLFFFVYSVSSKECRICGLPRQVLRQICVSPNHIIDKE